MATKRIHTQADLGNFPNTIAYESITMFITLASESVKGKKLSEPCFVSTRLRSVVDMLEDIARWADDIPLEEKCNQRFGNKAFRTWHQRLVDNSFQLVKGVLTSGENVVCSCLISPQWRFILSWFHMGLDTMKLRARHFRGASFMMFGQT